MKIVSIEFHQKKKFLSGFRYACAFEDFSN